MAEVKQTLRQGKSAMNGGDEGGAGAAYGM